MHSFLIVMRFFLCGIFLEKLLIEILIGEFDDGSAILPSDSTFEQILEVLDSLWCVKNHVLEE